MSDKTYTVKSLYAIANLDNGSAVHLHRGGVVPSNVQPGHLQHLLDNDIVEESAAYVGGLEPVHSGDLREQLTFPHEKAAKAADKRTGDPVDDDPDGDGPMPAKSASRADWDAYAKSQGLSDDEVAAFSSKEELQASFGVS